MGETCFPCLTRIAAGFNSKGALPPLGFANSPPEFAGQDEALLEAGGATVAVLHGAFWYPMLLGEVLDDDRAKTLVGEGIKSIRSVTRNLRPGALDDLGLVPALRALARDFEAEDTLQVVFDGPTTETSVGTDAELVLYRALQEVLSNAVRHGGCTRVDVRLSLEADHALLTVLDNGRGMPEDALQNLRSRGGLAGVRERVAAVQGDFEVGNGADGGARVRIQVPRVHHGGG